MATVGDILTAPEQNWIRLDDADSSISYSGNWIPQTETPNVYNNTRHITSSIASLTFEFYGNALRVIGTATATCSTTIEVNIDDTIIETFSSVSADGGSYNQTIIYEKFDLPKSNHTVTITNKDSGLWFQLDCFDIGVYSKKYLIKIPQDNKIYNFLNGSWNDTGLIEPLTEQNFINNGMNDLSIIPSDKWNEFNQFEVLMYTDDASAEPKLEVTATNPHVQTKTVSFYNKFYYIDDVDISNIDFKTGEKIKITAEDINSNISELLIDTIIANTEIQNPDLDPTEFHNEKIYLNATLYSAKGKVRYRILIDDIQYYPSSGFTDYLASPADLELSFLASEFENIGSHYIKIEAKNENGSTSTWEGMITKNNIVPTITAQMNRLTFTATIDDVERDKIQYKISVNGVQKYPESGFTELKSVPHNINYKFKTTDVNIDQMNTFVIDYKDTLGGADLWSHDFLATYQNIMFLDDGGEYYSDSEGNTIKYFDFGLVTAGITTESFKINVENLTGYSIQDLEVWIDKSTLPEGTDIKISFNNNPFIGEDLLHFNGTYIDGEQTYFYIKLITQPDATQGGMFKLRARCKQNC